MLSISRFASDPNGLLLAEESGTECLAALRRREGQGILFMTDDANAPGNLTKLAEEAKLVAETTQDPNRRRALRLMSLKYKRLADFARKRPEEGTGERGSER
jgi:hypothetical protein